MSQILEDEKEPAPEPVAPADVPQDPNDHQGTEDPTVPNDGGPNTATTAAVLETSVMPDNSHPEASPEPDPAMNFGIEEDVPPEEPGVEEEVPELDLTYETEERVEVPAFDEPPASLHAELESLRLSMERLKQTIADLTADKQPSDVDVAAAMNRKRDDPAYAPRVAAEDDERFTPLQFVTYLREYGRFTQREVHFLSESLHAAACDNRQDIEWPKTFRAGYLIVGLNRVTQDLQQNGQWSLLGRVLLARDLYLGSNNFPQNFVEKFLLKHSTDIDSALEEVAIAWQKLKRLATNFSPSTRSVST